MSTPKFEVFYDGDCPLCRREIAFLHRLDRRKGLVRFTDLTSTTFDPASIGKTRAELMGRIHGRDLRTGELVEGVEVFRQLYAAVGFGPLTKLTRVAPIAWTLDRAYEWFAKNRLWLTGREECTEGSCAIPARKENSSCASS